VLLEARADVNLGDTTTKRSPLHIAIHHGCYSAAELLIAHGADVNLVDGERWTPIARAAALSRSNVECRLILKLLISQAARLPTNTNPECLVAIIDCVKDFVLEASALEYVMRYGPWWHAASSGSILTPATGAGAGAGAAAANRAHRNHMLLMQLMSSFFRSCHAGFLRTLHEEYLPTQCPSYPLIHVRSRAPPVSRNHSH